MKTFREFILECELVEGKVEWDNPKRPLQSGWTPREKNRARRIKTGVENPDKPSFHKGGPGEKEYERYGKLKAAHDTEKDKKVSGKEIHKFKKSSFSGKTRGQQRRSNQQDKDVSSQMKQLKEPKD
jgi:hypothetical protein